MMIKKILVAVWVVVISAGPCVLQAKAEEGEKITVTGEVSVLTDENDEISEVFVSTDEEIYDIVLNATGNKLAQEMEGSKVEITGTVEHKDEALWLTVISYKEASVTEDEEEEEVEEE